MPSIEQEPLPRNALSSARLWTSPASRLGHRDSGSRRLFTPQEPLRTPEGPGPRPRAPLPTGDTLLWTSASLADFCNLKQRAGTPNERSILAREWSFRPAARRHQPMPVALARDTLPHRGPASLELHAPACARRVPLAWTGQLEGRSVRVKASRALLDDVARALLVALRAPGSPVRLATRPGDLVARRTGLGSSLMPPREGRHRRKNQGAFCRTGTLTRAEDGSSVRAWTAVSSRRLRRGIARKRARLCYPLCSAFF
jgi:hypothetical protein